ncbi:hypothetical protein H6758_03190 [Candidatus Nomurabacteria bacterium]|nr:hypothetical protein [Candidatus Nomurabacteria bacterium]
MELGGSTNPNKTQELYALRQYEQVGASDTKNATETRAEPKNTEVFDREKPKGPSFQEQARAMNDTDLEIELAVLADQAHEDQADNEVFARRVMTLSRELQTRIEDTYRDKKLTKAEIEALIQEIDNDPNSHVSFHPSGIKRHVLGEQLRVATASERAKLIAETAAQGLEHVRRGLAAAEGFDAQGQRLAVPEAYDLPSDEELQNGIDTADAEEQGIHVEEDGDVFTSAPDYTGTAALGDTQDLPRIRPQEQPANQFRIDSDALRASSNPDGLQAIESRQDPIAQQEDAPPDIVQPTKPNIDEDPTRTFQAPNFSQ